MTAGGGALTERAFFAGLLLRNGGYKTTEEHRMDSQPSASGRAAKSPLSCSPRTSRTMETVMHLAPRDDMRRVPHAAGRTAMGTRGR